MSYLARLARRAETPARAAAPQASVNDCADDRASSVTRHVEASAVPAPPVVESPTRPTVPRNVAPRAEEPGRASLPVVTLRDVAPSSLPPPEIEATPTREALSPTPRPALDATPAPHRTAEVVPATTPPPLHDRPGHELAQPIERAPTRRPAPVAARAEMTEPRTAGPASSARDKVSVHIGAISLTVKAPAPAAPPAASVAMPVAQPLPAAAPPRSREGLGFSASRHYLRWS